MHEVGGQASGNKRDHITVPSGSQSPVASENGGKRDYVAQFPALGPPSTSQSHTNTPSNVNYVPQRNPQPSNGKRDYVAPQFPAARPAQQNNQQNGGSQLSHNNRNGGNSNYASQFPSLGPPSTSQTHTPASYVVNSGPQSNSQSSNGKRDYVAPQFPTLKPVQPNNQPTGGKVKDLINFYDNKNPSQGTHSYSSILQGSSNKNGPIPTVTLPSTRFTQPTQSPLTTSSIYTPKPMSFSSVLAGNKPSIHSTLTTPKPTTRIPTSSMSRPGTPVLPSSIVNNNRGTTNTNSVSDAELEALSEELLRKDTNNAAKYITVNYQEKTTSQSKEDKAPLP